MRFLPPILLHYYITERCNCRCSFCDIWKNPTKKSDDAKLDDVVRTVGQAKKIGVRFVDFTGGEPLLHDDLPDMLRHAKRVGLRTSITTNCLRYEKIALQLVGLVDFLHFSLDALNAEKHDAIRGQSAFSHVMKSLDRARALGEIPDLLFTVNRDNIDQLEPMADFARQLQFMLVVNPVFAYADFEGSDVDVLAKIERLSSRPFVYVNKAFHRLRRSGGNDVNKPRCRVMHSTIVISPDNRVVLPCYHFQQEKVSIDKCIASRSTFLFGRRGDLQRREVPFFRKSPDFVASRNDLASLRNSPIWRHYHKNQGRFDFCQGCHLNCYFDPSFHYKLDDYFWFSSLAKSKYWWDKKVRRTFFSKRMDDRPAAEIANEIMSRYAKS